MEKQQKENQQRKSNESKQAKPESSAKFRDYARYSGMAMQLGITIALGAFVGQKLDEWLALDTPLMTAFISLLATIAGIYLLIRDILQK